MMQRQNNIVWFESQEALAQADTMDLWFPV